MLNTDFQHLKQYRLDGRKSNELRPTSIELGIDRNYDGSCLFRQGLTTVLCVCHGPYHKVSQKDNLLKIQYTVSPFSSYEKKNQKYNKQFSQFTQNIRKSYEAIILAEQYTRSQIQITVTILQSSGSAKSTVLNCITLTLADAGICMKDLVVSCTIGIYNSSMLIDTNEEEQYQSTNEMIVSFIHRNSKIDCLQLKKAKIKKQQLDKMYVFVIQGCQQLYKYMRKVLIQYCHKKMLIF